MSDSHHRSRHLDASGPRDVVYCHQCYNQWYKDDRGLKCPCCEGEITEIVSTVPDSTRSNLTSQQVDSESDPRPGQDENEVHQQPEPGLRGIHNHNPWDDVNDSDPDEADIEEHVRRGPGNSILVTRTIRGSNGRARDGGDPSEVLNSFQSMLTNFMGQDLRHGMPGRSGPGDMFPPRMEGGFRLGGNGSGPQIVGGQYTYTTNGRFAPRNGNGPQDLHTLLGSMFGSMAPLGEGDANRGAMPNGLQGLFASLLSPANARAGDAAYSQEALDEIISELMDQHPSSNAPGPASPGAIAALPKKNLDEKLLGPEGKGECTVCMDDVSIGDEVVQLPCSHWFHEPCVAAWLSEHNTCPICRKGIEGDAAASPSSPNSQAQASGDRTRPPRRLSLRSPRFRSSDNARNDARLESIRNTSRLYPEDEGVGPRRYQIVDDGAGSSDYTRHMAGSFTSPRRRDSEMSENQRDGRRTNTSGSDESRNSRRSSGTNSANTGSGPINWLRDRFGGNSYRR